jgi:hypothetical protein
VPTERAWRRLVELVHAAADDRVVVSSEFFAKGRHAAIQRVVQELGAQRVHVVVTLRPLSRILASSWQQAVQNGLRVPYEQWLEATLRPGPAGMTPRFWLAHDHARLVRKWSSAAGAGRLSVIIVDPSDPRMLPEAFERLLSLPTGMLECAADVTNRSLSAAEAELVRRLNELCAAAEVDEDLRGRLVRDGVSRHLKEAYRLGPEDSPITTPDWALDCAAARDRATAEAIQRLEVRVIGEVTALTRPAERLDVPDLSRVSIEAAAQAALGVVLATQAWRAAPGEERPLRIVTSRELARVVARRAAKRLLRRRVVARPNPAP